MTLVCHKLSKQSVLNVIHVVPCLVSLLNRVVNNYHVYVFCIRLPVKECSALWV
jgi:hypothetical protein